jgi:hypothetical protein
VTRSFEVLSFVGQKVSPATFLLFDIAHREDQGVVKLPVDFFTRMDLCQRTQTSVCAASFQSRVVAVDDGHS